MAISLYSGFVPVSLQLLAGLKTVLKKAEDHATAQKWDTAVVLNLRFYPDMFTLERQVRQVCNHALGAGRVAGVDLPNLGDQDNSWAEIHARIDKTVDFLKGLQGQPARRQGRFRRHGHDRRPAAHDEGAELPVSFRHAAGAVPRDDGVRHPARRRRQPRQARLPRPNAVVTRPLFRDCPCVPSRNNIVFAFP